MISGQILKIELKYVTLQAAQNGQSKSEFLQIAAAHVLQTDSRDPARTADVACAPKLRCDWLEESPHSSRRGLNDFDST